MSEKKILVLEENADHALLIKRAFNSYGKSFSLLILQDFSAFLTALEKGDPYDLILFAHKRDDDKGLTVLKHPGIKNRIPVVFLSGPADEFKGVELIKNGALDYIAKSYSNIRNLPSNILRVLREWENISARRQAEEKLLESESKYRRVTDNIHDVIWEMEPDMQKFTFISDSIIGFLGYHAEEFLTASPRDVIDPQSLNMLLEEKRKIIQRLKNGESLSKASFLKEVAFIHTDKKLRWGEVRGFLVVNDTGRVVAVSGIVRNITEQKQAQKQLEIQEAYFETLIREAPLAIVILDNHDRIKQVNNQFLQLFEYTEEECIDKPVNDLIVPEELKEEGNTLTLQAARGDYINQESVRHTKSGKPVDVHILGKPIMLKDSKLGVFGMYQDISQRKKIEVAEKVAEIKQQFLANMSHEIRSPMTGIMGMLDLLQKTLLTQKQKVYVDVIKKSSDGLLNIVNDILDLSKIEAGKMIIRPHKFNLRDSAHNLYSLFDAVARKKELDFILELDPRLPGSIIADENRISQIITNLLSNAIKFTSEGSILLRYELIEKLTSKCTLRITVKDTGIGICKEDKEKLFKIFSQIDTSDTRNFEGTGLGLSISEKLAELMGARIEVESEKGQGSIFGLVITVPFEEGVKEQQKEEPDVLQGDHGVSGATLFRVLLTEDKRTNQMVISLMLREAGCRVDIASNGKEALERIEQSHYDFIFMDIQMPVMDGYTAVKELRKTHPQGRPPFIIGLSAKAMEGDAEYYIANGMDDYLTKPVDSETLHQCMKKWWHRQ